MKPGLSVCCLCLWLVGTSAVPPTAYGSGHAPQAAVPAPRAADQATAAPAPAPKPDPAAAAAAQEVDWDGDCLRGAADPDPVVNDVRNILDMEALDPVFRCDLHADRLTPAIRCQAGVAADTSKLEFTSLIDWRRAVAAPVFPAGAAPLPALANAAAGPAVGPGDWGGARVTMPGTDPATACKQREADLKTVRLVRLAMDRPQLLFTLLIHNGTAAALDCRELRVPLLVAGRVLAHARPVRDAQPLPRFTVPPGVQRQLFAASLGVEIMADMLDTMTVSQVITLGLNMVQGSMVDMRTGHDMLPVALLAEKACLRLTLDLPNGCSLLWLVARRHPGLVSDMDEGFTVRQVFETVQAHLGQAGVAAPAVFTISAEARLAGVLGLPSHGPCLWDLEVDNMPLGPTESLEQGAVTRIALTYRDHQSAAENCQQAGDRAAAWQHWSVLAQTGYRRGIASVGIYELFGWGTGPQNAPAGFRKILTAAEQKDAVAMNALGVLLVRGENMRQDPRRGQQWLTQAAAAAFPAAEYNLGRVLMGDSGVPADLTQAIAWLERSLQHGCVAAAEALGDGYALKLRPPDYQAAVRYYQMAAAAGRPAAQFALGLCFFLGRGVAVDRAAGTQWMVKAAAGGWPAAQRTVGLRTMVGDSVIRDPVSGLERLRQGAVGGDAVARQALFVMGDAPPQGTSAPVQLPLLFW